MLQIVHNKDMIEPSSNKNLVRIPSKSSDTADTDLLQPITLAPSSLFARICNLELLDEHLTSVDFPRRSDLKSFCKFQKHSVMS